VRHKHGYQWAAEEFVMWVASKLEGELMIFDALRSAIVENCGLPPSRRSFGKL
jgi:hypothetical protein